MQHHMQHAIEMQHPLRSLRQADTSHGGEESSHAQQQHYPQHYPQHAQQSVAPKPCPEEGGGLQGGVSLSPREQPPQPRQYTNQQYSGVQPTVAPSEQQYTPPPRNVAFAAQSPLDEAIEKLHLLSDEARTGDQIMAEEHAEGEQNTARSCFHTMYQVRGGI